MKRLLLIAGVFAGATLIFFGVAGVQYYSASASASQAQEQWSASETMRTKYVTKRNELSSMARGALPASQPDVLDILTKLLQQCGIDRAKMKNNTNLPSGNRAQAIHSVAFNGLSLKDMAALLGGIDKQHPCLRVRELHATAEAKPEEYTWTMQIAAPLIEP